MKFKDVAHLYLGCRIRHNILGDGFLTPQWLSDIAYMGCPSMGPLVEDEDSYVEWREIRAILYPINSMTTNQMQEIWHLVFGRTFGINGSVQFFDKSDVSSKRWVLMSGVERLCIGWDGYIWSDSDLQKFRFSQHEVTAWLLKERFDLFNLIPSGEAIDATTLPENQKSNG